MAIWPFFWLSCRGKVLLREKPTGRVVWANRYKTKGAVLRDRRKNETTLFLPGQILLFEAAD